MFPARPFALAGLMALVAASVLGPSDANAQQIYRIVGPDGRVTFSDKAPLEPNARATSAAVVVLPSDGSPNLNGLPFEVRQAAARYPVTLYTAPGCNSCGTGRSMLMNRGIPFSEKTVISNDDFEALKRISGNNGLPMLTIGAQQLKGYGESEWSQFLDAAGYPKTSQLPPSYLPAPASPLVAIDTGKPPSPASAQRPATAATNPDQPPAPTDNPAGIRF